MTYAYDHAMTRRSLYNRLQEDLNQLIALTPTGQARDKVTDANMALMLARQAQEADDATAATISTAKGERR